MTRRCWHGPFAPERKAIRSGPWRGSSRWIQRPWASGSSAPPSRVGWSSWMCGHSCPAERVRGTNDGALSRRQTSLSRGRTPLLPPRALPGLGSRVPRSGAWSWPVSSARAHQLQPIDGWSGSRLSRRTCSPVFPALNGRHTVPPCSLCTDHGLSRHGVERGARLPSHGAFPTQRGARPTWCRRGHGVAWWRSTIMGCVETDQASPHAWPHSPRARPSRPAWSNERLWRFAHPIVD